jgi:CRP-like cAMP-binding protein
LTDTRVFDYRHVEASHNSLDSMVKVKKAEDEQKASVTMGAGDYIYRQGDPATDLFLIEKGSVELVKGASGDEGVLRTLEAGDFFGEASLLAGGPRESSARAATSCDLLKVDGPTLKELLRDPEVALRMLRRLSYNLAALQEKKLQTEKAPAKAKSKSGTGVMKALPVSGGRLVHASGVEIALPDKDESLVGRADPKGGYVPDIDLTSLDSQRSLSRRHARIVRKGGELFVKEEPGVRNGTFVNGKAVRAGMSAAVKDGDEVSFGLIKTVLRFA